MAAIDTYLQQIQAAVYGEEVRGSIHDAIAAINTENQSVLTTANSYKNAAQTANTNAQAAKAAAVSAQGAAESARDRSVLAETNASNAKDRCEAYANSMSEVEDMRDTMLSSNTVTDVLLDSSGNTLLDNTGNEILSIKIFVDASEVYALSQKLASIETLLMGLLRYTLSSRVGVLESNISYLINHALIDSVEED